MTTIKSRAWLTAILVAIIGYGLDFVSKLAATKYLNPLNPPSFFNGLVKLQIAYNPGAAFSLGINMTFALSIFAILAFICVLLFGLPRVKNRWQAIAVGLLLAGIAGNLTDRLIRAPGPLHGYVVDMIQLPYFAIFNVADMCITCAAVLIVLLSFRRHE